MNIKLKKIETWTFFYYILSQIILLLLLFVEYITASLL